MGSTKTFHALYNDDDILLSAVKKIKEKHYDIDEVYTPFPVHGLDKVMGLEPTRIAIAAFIYGCIGITVATLMMNYIMIVDWPQNIGGKPSFSYIENMPAFVPIMFEMTWEPFMSRRVSHIKVLKQPVFPVWIILRKDK